MMTISVYLLIGGIVCLIITAVVWGNVYRAKERDYQDKVSSGGIYVVAHTTFPVFKVGDTIRHINYPGRFYLVTKCMFFHTYKLADGATGDSFNINAIGGMYELVHHWREPTS